MGQAVWKIVSYSSKHKTQNDYVTPWFDFLIKEKLQIENEFFQENWNLEFNWKFNFSKRTENTCPQKHSYTTVHSNFINNCSMVKTDQHWWSINGWTKVNVVHSWNDIEFSSKKFWHVTVCISFENNLSKKCQPRKPHLVWFCLSAMSRRHVSTDTESRWVDA